MNHSNNSNRKILIVIACNNFCDEEYEKSRKILESNNFTCKVASSSFNSATGMDGIVIKPNYNITNVDIEKFEGIIFIGGVGCTEYYHNTILHKKIYDAYKSNILISAICLAPVILVNAGVLGGKRATAHPSAAEYMKRKGVNFSSQHVEMDENIITADGPETTESFVLTIIKYLESLKNVSLETALIQE